MQRVEWLKRDRTETSYSEVDTEGGGEASKSRCMKGHMTNIYLTDPLSVASVTGKESAHSIS